MSYHYAQEEVRPKSFLVKWRVLLAVNYANILPYMPYFGPEFALIPMLKLP